MRTFFKNSNKEIFEFSDDQLSYVDTKNLTKLTEEEVLNHLANNSLVPSDKVSERLWRDAELRKSDIELNKVQDSDPKAVGTVTQWREYRKALRAWPENENFPDEAYRPVSPLTKE